MWLRRLLLATALGLTLGGAASGDEPSDDVPVQFGGPFSLTDHDGAPRTDADFRGRYLLVHFGYTACPDLCPLGLTSLSAALDLLGGAADPIQPLFISVDPARDTVARMRVFVGRFHPRLIGLTGSGAEVGAAARVCSPPRPTPLRTRACVRDQAVGAPGRLSSSGLTPSNQTGVSCRRAHAARTRSTRSAVAPPAMTIVHTAR